MRFSIVISTYNRGHLIGDTIRSILNQAFPDFELIIVDDGSTDNTQAVIHQFQHAKIRYFKKENGERAAGRNYGIERSNAEYITFIDSDDLLQTDHLSIASSVVDKDCPDVFHLGYNVIDSKGAIITPWKSLPNPVNFKLIEGNFLSCLGVFVKKEVLLRNKFNEDRALAGSEDYELWLRLGARYSIVTYPFVTSALVHHEQRSMVQVNPANLMKRIELLRHYLTLDEEFLSAYKNYFGKWSAYLDLYLALHLALLNGYKSKAACVVFQALMSHPAIIMNKRFWVVLKKLVLPSNF